MENKSFKCYELFHKIGKELPSELQAKYYIALMEYGLYGIEPEDQLIKSLLQGPIYSIQKTNEIKNKQSSGGKNHTGNQYTKGDAKWQAQKKAVEVSGSIVEVCGRPMEDNGTKKNRSIEDNNIKKENIKEKKIEDRFEEFWIAYPLKKGKAKAHERYKQSVKQGVSEDLLITKAKEYAEECKIKNTEPNYIKRAEGWLNSGRYEDTYITAKPKPKVVEDKQYDFKPTLSKPKLPGILNLKKES